MTKNVLIVGAGIGGPALASLLQRSSVTSQYHITVVERSPELRASGQQIDVKGQGVSLLQKMGVLEAIKSSCVAESGFELLDSKDRLQARFGVSAADKPAVGFTSEYEIMRSDLVRIFYEDSLAQRAKVDARGGGGSLTYEFGKTLTAITQIEGGVDVKFTDDQTRRFDLVIGADGQGSRTRRLAFEKEVNDAAFRAFGIHAAYYSIPRLESEGTIARGYSAPQQFLFTRTSGRPVTGAYIFTTKNNEELRRSYAEPIEQRKQVWINNITGIGWQADRFVREMRTSTDFYAHELGQIKLPSLHTGRVVLVGDAGYCPSPLTGLGTSCALVGAYVLAGELAHHGNDIDAALLAHEETMRVPIEENQKLAPGGPQLLFPTTKFGVRVLNSVAWFITRSGIVKLATKLMGGDDDEKRWKLPVYEELKFGVEG